MDAANGVEHNVSEETGCPTGECVGMQEWLLAGFGMLLGGILIYMAVDILTGSKVSTLVSGGPVITGELAD